MSHIVIVATEIRDAVAVRAACRRLNLPQPVHGRHQLFSGEANGLAVELPDWTYPVVCDLSTGQVRFDNYNGRWGDQTRLDAFFQSYAVEKCRIEAQKKGYDVTEQSLGDGSIKLVVAVEGGAS